METIYITKEAAKSYLVDYQGLMHIQEGKLGIENYIKKVGCIQFDPLDVVGRNPDLMMQSRIKDYSPKMLNELLYEDRVLIDGWDKMMSIHHVEDWPYLKRIRDEHAKSNINIMKHRGTVQALDYLEQVKEMLKQEGPKFSREINFSGVEKGRWSSNKYANIALDHLFHLGEIGILKKNNNQKCFDVIENLLEEQILAFNEPFSSEDAFLRWYIKRRIASVGMLWSRNGGGWLGHFISDKSKRDYWINAMVDEGELYPVRVEGIKELLYISNENLTDLKQTLKNEIKEVKILAPLDNLLWDRALVEVLFNFKYSWEVYIPESRRKYGYYVLPVMYGEKIIARFEPVKSTKGEPLQIKKWWWEEDVEINEPLLIAIEKGLSRFAKYLEATDDAKEYRHVILSAKNI